MKKIIEEIEINGRNMVIETGELARLADGAVKVSYGETVILATCCVAESKEKFGFFPLTVDYRERTYAAGKIPGGFFKREGRPHEKEIITSRLIDRPIRPLFPDGYSDQVQIAITVLSSDGENDSDIPAMIGASCALCLSPAPFMGPVGAVRIAKKEDQFIINPTFEELQKCECEFIIAGTQDAITMLEGEAFETSEEDILKAINIARAEIEKLTRIQKELIDKAGVKKIEVVPPEIDKELEEKITSFSEAKILDVYRKGSGKTERSNNLKSIREQAIENFAVCDGQIDEEKASLINTIMKNHEKELLRKLIKEEKLRVDGRTPEQLREINCQAGVLPRTHGSGTFTKGETQSLAVVTLGTSADQQIMDVLEGEYKKHFMLHYNFPPHAVGEVSPMRGPGRREIGHGVLAEKALFPLLPKIEEFPYTIRLVSDILESNGSSSMASICAGSIALMDAGVPLKAPVAGVGMGIIEGVILTDMLGDEDHAGDMDFKVAGTRSGVTAIQLDIKIKGISEEVLREGLEHAKRARIQTLDEIEKTISQPRESLSQYAPRLETLIINPDKIGTLIGPGGKHIKKIQEETGVSIDIDDDGTVLIGSVSGENLERAIELVKSYTEDAQPGKIYEGEVKKILEFGAFVEILPGKTGLVHISELAPYRVNKVEDILKIGDRAKVKCIGIDDKGRVNLSRVEALSKEEREKEKKEHYNE